MNAQPQPGAPGPFPRVRSVEAYGRFWHVVFRDAERFAELRVPGWARRAAGRYCPGALVRTGRLQRTGAWKVQAVLVPLKDGTDPADVADVAWRIMARIEGG